MALLGGGGIGGRRSGERSSTDLRLETSMSSENKVRVSMRLASEACSKVALGGAGYMACLHV